MSAKIKGLLFGSLLSLGGVAIWILISLIGFISAWAAVAMAYFFYFGYNKCSQERKEKSFFVTMSVVVFLEILLATFIGLLMVAGQNGITIADVFASTEYMQGVYIDLGVGLLFGALGVGIMINNIIRGERNR